MRINRIRPGLTGWPRGTHTPTLASNLSSMDLNLGPAMKYHPGVSQIGLITNVCAVPPMDVQLGVSSTDIRWWMLKIPRVSFSKSKQVIGAMNKLQILALTTAAGKAIANHPV